MVDRPPATAAFAVRDAGFPFDQQPATRVVPVDLRSRQQMNTARQQLLSL